MQLAAPVLLARLRATYPTPPGWPFDVPAALDALAYVETRRRALVGDAGRSFGPWQIHDPPAPYSPPTWNEPARLGYELQFIQGRLLEVMHAIASSARILAARAAAGEPIRFDAAAVRDWMNIAWQFGSGDLVGWAQRRDRFDYSGEAWAGEISPSSNVTPAQYLARLSEFRSTYSSNAATPAPAIRKRV